MMSWGNRDWTEPALSTIFQIVCRLSLLGGRSRHFAKAKVVGAGGGT
jgi:hypothetical protein